MEAERKIFISIETAIGGGSLSILEDGKQIDTYRNRHTKVSQAEDLLEQLSKVLKRNRVGSQQIRAVCVSKGASSQTTEKIGLAISKGLSRALGCQLIVVPILDALLLKVKKDFRGKIIVAVATRANRIFWQSKRKDGALFFDLTKPVDSTLAEFRSAWNARDYDLLISLSTDEGNLLLDRNHLLINVEHSEIAGLIGEVAVKLRV